MRDQYMRSCDAMMIVFDITNRQSFEETKAMYELLLRINDTDSFPALLVGNKADLTAYRVISQQEATSLAASLNIPYFETSAKSVKPAVGVSNLISYRTRVNVHEAFVELVRQTPRTSINYRSTSRLVFCRTNL